MNQRLNGYLIDLLKARAKDIREILSFKFVDKLLVGIFKVHLPHNTILVNLET